MKFQKRNGGFTLIELLICLVIPAALALVGGALYVAYHFISKFW